MRQHQLLRALIKEILSEAGLSGKLRSVRGKQQYKIGRVPEDNQELSSFEAESQFPGSTDTWTQIVPEMYPEFPFTNPRVIKQRSAWFRIGNRLRVAFADMPQVELMEWDPSRQDWFDIEEDMQKTA